MSSSSANYENEAASAPVVTATLPKAVKSDVVEYVRLDDGLKTARDQMKGARSAMNDSRDRIVAYMRDNEVVRLGIKKGTQYLELVEKQLKIRPIADCVKQKIAELLRKNVTDPEVIYQEISSCGGTKQIWKLARRTKRSGKAGGSSSASSKQKGKKRGGGGGSSETSSKKRKGNGALTDAESESVVVAGGGGGTTVPE